MVILMANMGGRNKFLDDYVPAIPEPYWRVIREFVLTAVGSASGRTPYGDRDLLLVTTRLALWCWQSAALPLDFAVVFRREVVERFCTEGLGGYSDASRGNLRSQLLRMGELFLEPRSAPRRLAPLSASKPSKPYSAVEQAILRSWSESESTAARRQNAQVLLALGFGAGLSTIEIGELRGSGLVVDDLGVLVSVSRGRVRTVPVLRSWEPALRERKRHLADDRYVFREGRSMVYDNMVSNFVSRSRSRDLLPQAQRLRATWIVHHLDAGTPLAAVLEAAGIESLEALTRYLKFVRPVEPSLFREALMGSRQ